MSSHDVPSTGLVAGKYELMELIGRGGMGSVWKGRHATLGTLVAIKFIEKEYSDSTEARARFDNEARAAAAIQSKHAIQIHDHGVTHDGKPYIVMELLIGEALDKRIERMGRLSLQETARILQQACRGLARAHERGIVHRDLKPENIFLVRGPDDEEEIAKVLDFGIAKIKKEQQGGVSSSTKTGAVLGTPFYMSPEQARGLRNVDHRTDIWSLGVIAFKCVTGRLPFEGESIGDLLVKICTSPVPMPSSYLQGLPASFDAWFARALDREPDRRFSSTTELAEALAYAAGISVRRGPGSAPVGSVDPAYGRTAPGIPSGGVPTSALGGSTPQPGYGSQPAGYPPRSAAAGYGPALTPGGGPAGIHPPPPAMGATSAPLTSSTGLPTKSRTPLVATLVVGLFVLAGSFAGATFLLRKDKPATGAGAKGSEPVQVSAGAGAPGATSASIQAPALDPSAPASAATGAFANATATAPAKPATTGQPARTATVRPTSTTATTKPTGTGALAGTTTTKPTATIPIVIAPTTTAPPTATVTTAPTKPTATGRDQGPGY